VANRATHLSQTMKADICAHYANGMTLEELGKEYNVSGMTISRIIKANQSFVSDCEKGKKEAEEKALSSMDEWVKAKLGKATNLCEKIMAEVSQRDLSEESIRDLAGLFKIMREAFVPKTQVADEKESQALNKIADSLNRLVEDGK